MLVPGQPREIAPGDRSIEERAVEVVTPETDAAIERGLEWLASRQNEDGSFGTGGNYSRNVAVPALCGMAFLSAGHTPGRGPYGSHVEKAVEYVLAQCQPSGFIVNPQDKSHGPMYGHGFATLFLAEVYGMAPSEAVREKLEKAVQLIVRTQNEEGGWRYDPTPHQVADVSVTVCQMMALRAARNCGISVPKETVDQCVAYVKANQNADGGFRYQLVQRGAESMFPRSAAAVVGLYNAGVFEGPAVQRGLDYLMRYLPRGEIFQYESYYYYGHYYAVQAMWHAGGEYWKAWYPAIRDELIQKQLPHGAWSDTSICNEYATAMALLVLQLPNNYLPIFQR
jgi:squalene cyclase